ncbi:MAG: hypothetical protein NC938_00515 [Candidatus Omnitrophica bacterium]|nr:hypothetical protein [Candidatus Omnitrophota bacterium]MCM8790171.1 hypothetical protein [Candidatus Omnitrophota bacterium]
MKYKTIIKITSEARDKNEAIEIVDDYLAGNIRTGVDMKCATKPECNSVKITCAIAICLVILWAIVVPTQLNTTQSQTQSSPAFSAVQPPLNTERANPDFKKRWEERRIRETPRNIRG